MYYKNKKTTLKKGDFLIVAFCNRGDFGSDFTKIMIIRSQEFLTIEKTTYWSHLCLPPGWEEEVTFSVKKLEEHRLERLMVEFFNLIPKKISSWPKNPFEKYWHTEISFDAYVLEDIPE